MLTSRAVRKMNTCAGGQLCGGHNRPRRWSARRLLLNYRTAVVIFETRVTVVVTWIA